MRYTLIFLTGALNPATFLSAQAADVCIADHITDPRQEAASARNADLLPGLPRQPMA